MYDFRSSSRFRQLGRTFTRKPQNAMLTKRKYNVLRGNIGEEKRKVGVPARVEWRIVLSTDGRFRPAAAKQAGIQEQIDWHRLRQTYGTLVKSQGATTQALMRHANASITMDRYVQAVTPAKRDAQAQIVHSIPFPSRLTETAVTG